MKINYLKLLGSIILCQGAGMIGALATMPAITTWYAYLQKPPIAPPNWIFAPVWTLLYLLMAIAFYLVWQQLFKNDHTKQAIIVFLVQLFLNIGWSFVFFGLKSPGFGVIVILVLLLTILLTMIKFYQIDKKACYLLVPYLLWVSFASILNILIWQLN